MSKMLSDIIATGRHETERYIVTTSKLKYYVYDKNNILIMERFQCGSTFTEIENLLTE